LPRARRRPRKPDPFKLIMGINRRVIKIPYFSSLFINLHRLNAKPFGRYAALTGPRLHRPKPMTYGRLKFYRVAILRIGPHCLSKQRISAGKHVPLAPLTPPDQIYTFPFCSAPNEGRIAIVTDAGRNAVDAGSVRARALIAGRGFRVS
jgi:hypothetical protein